MISNELENLSDKLLGYAAKGSFVPPEVSANMAAVLLEHAKVARVLEGLPFTASPRAATRRSATRRNAEEEALAEIRRLATELRKQCL